MIRKDSEALCAFLDSFSSRYERLGAEEKIALHCYVPRHTVRNWKYGLSRIPVLHKLKIEEIFNQTIFDRLPNW